MAERLTMTSDKGGVAFTFDLDITCRPSEAQKILKLAEKLKCYEDLEEGGKLIELPCKIGDTVYYINTHNRLSLFKNTVYEAKVARFVTTRYGTSIVIQIRNEYGCTELYSEDNYNKTVFLTKEEAEAALKGAEE